jgi:hypothetical protein
MQHDGRLRHNNSVQYLMPGLAPRHMKKRVSASIRVNPRLFSG